MTSDGVPPDALGTYPFATGTPLTLNLSSSATATGAGSVFSGESTGLIELYAEMYSEYDILLNFAYDWARDYTLTNTVDGDHTHTFINATAELWNDSNSGFDPDDSVQFIDGGTSTNGSNIGNISPFEISNSDSGSGVFALLLSAGEFATISITADIASRAETSPIPLPATAWLFVTGLLGLAGLSTKLK
ncbi:MAG: VPLPA-CTERM sorting domain-containing protein [Candidatus Thiodiazotropha sp.]